MNDRIKVQDVTPTYDLYQTQDKIYIRRTKGLFRNLRFFGNLFLFAVFFLGVWATWDDRQAILFDLPARKFHILGITFWPQDLMLLAWFFIIAAFALFFVTVFAGRVWCGYTCPQSAWTWIFVWIEEKTEGLRNARIKQDKEPVSIKRTGRKLLKHLLWLLVAFWTAVTFVGYFVPIRELLSEIATFEVAGWSLFFLFLFTVATYGNAGWLREQVCLYMCPYARFQSVMFDKDTLIVSYDEKRGEPRGSRKRSDNPAELGLGSCIDCDLCVQVCPTGIDIRDGLQYECISCAACIDACDSVMDKMGYARELISYTTEHNLSGEKTRLLRPRLFGYGIALLAMLTTFSIAINTRTPLEMDIIRDRDVLHRITADGQIENAYELKIMNMTDEIRTFSLELSGLEGLTLAGSPEINVNAGEARAFRVRMIAPPSSIERPSHKISLTLTDQNDPSLSVTEESRFFGPINK